MTSHPVAAVQQALQVHQARAAAEAASLPLALQRQLLAAPTADAALSEGLLSTRQEDERWRNGWQQRQWWGWGR